MKLSVNPQFARLALKTDTEIGYVIWVSLREWMIQRNHSGKFSKAQVYEVTRYLGFSKRHIRRVIAKCNGIYWGRDDTLLYIRSPHRVRLNLENLADDKFTPHDIYAESFSISFADMSSTEIKAWLYYTLFYARGEMTISRASLQDETGLSPQVQRRYEEILSDVLAVRHNYAHIDTEFYRDNPSELPAHHYEIGYERVGTSGESDYINAIQYQLANTYIALPFNADISTTNGALSVRRAILARRWHSNSYIPTRRLYCKNWHEFERHGTENSFIRTYYDGKKRLWASGQY